MNFIKCSSSVFIITFYLFILVYAKMEMRRLGYVAFKSSTEHQKAKDEYNINLLKYTRLTNFTRLKNLAVKNKFKDGKQGRVIQMTSSKLAVPN